MPRSLTRLLVAVAISSSVLAAPAGAQERMCDPAYENCRAILIDLIRNETVGIDVAFWFMRDARYSNEIVSRAQAGVPVRVLVDPRANSSNSMNGQILAQLAAAGIPMRYRASSGILHWKMMLFAGQRRVQFSGANYSPDAFVYNTPYSNYVDEAIYFTDDLAIVQSFMRRFDDLWTSTTHYRDYANIIAPLLRRYALYDIHPDLNFPPSQSYRSRATARYRAEASGMDVVMYRITDRAHSDAVIAAVNRGVRVRLITEQEEYRNPDRPWHAWNVDRLHMAGVQVRHRAHQGLNHQKSVLLHGQGMAIFGSSNWTSPSSDSQDEHNYFTTKGWIVSWFESQFERKWNNLGPSPETEPFRPLPPARPVNISPASGATGVRGSELTFDAGPFAHLYDIYFGTTSDPPLLEANVDLGPTTSSRTPRRYHLPPVAGHTTYYWRVVAKTMADQQREGPTWSFMTGEASGPQPAPQPQPAPGPAPAPPPAPTGSPRPAMYVDLPAANTTLRQPFTVAGWALDASAVSGTGVDAIHVYAYPASGASPIFLGEAALGWARPDVGGIFGSAFTPSGYGLTVRSLAPGDYMLVVFARSTVAGTFAISRALNVRVESSAMLWLDLPAQGSSTDRTFVVAGWALDSAAASGGGVDLVHVYAYPLDTGGAPLFLGQTTASGSRPDVGAAFGSRYARAGFHMTSPSVPPGRYRVVAYGRSQVTWAFTVARTADITVR